MQTFRYKSWLKCLSKVVRKDGIRGLYAGELGIKEANKFSIKTFLRDLACFTGQYRREFSVILCIWHNIKSEEFVYFFFGSNLKQKLSIF